VAPMRAEDEVLRRQVIGLTNGGGSPVPSTDAGPGLL
jgi:hypothetical protein